MRNGRDGLRKGKETDNNRRRAHMQGKLFLGRRRHYGEVKMCASHRLQKNDGEGQQEGKREGGKGMSCPAWEKLSRSFSRRVSRLPSRLPRPYPPPSFTLIRTRVHTTAREIPLSLFPPRRLSLSLLRPLTPSPRGEGWRNASKNPSN